MTRPAGVISFGPNAPAWLGLGWIIALIVGIVALILVVIHQLDTTVGLLIIGLALARLL